MNWQLLQRRLPLPLAGCVLGASGYLASLRPATADSLLTRGYQAIWNGETAGASQPILDALRLDSGSPERWADLAEAMHARGRDNDTRYCLEQEILRGGHLPHVAMRAAGMYFRLGDPTAALLLTNRVVNDTREYDANVFQAWQHLGGTSAAVFERGVGNNTVAGRGYFMFLLGSGDASVTSAAWHELKKKGMAGVEESRFYAESLTNLRDYEQAAAIESQILPDGIWNGGFENPLTGRGLDWKAESVTGVAVSRDTTERKSGTTSLRLEFDGESRGDFERVSETRVLAAGNWTLRASVRTELKGTVSQVHGIGLLIQDPLTGRVLAETNRVNGNTGWTTVEANFDAGTHARPVVIAVVRPETPPSELTMTGMAWVDDVTLSPEKSR